MVSGSGMVSGEVSEREAERGRGLRELCWWYN